MNSINELKFSIKGKDLYTFTIDHIEFLINKYNFLRTQVIYPAHNSNKFFSIELSKIFEQLVDEFKLKNPFDNKNSEYFAFLKETALKILKSKVESDSPDLYAFCYQTEKNKIVIIIKEPGTLGITKLIYSIKQINNKYKKLILLKNIKLASNAYTNPLFSLKI